MGMLFHFFNFLVIGKASVLPQTWIEGYSGRDFLSHKKNPNLPIPQTTRAFIIQFLKKKLAQLMVWKTWGKYTGRDDTQEGQKSKNSERQID
jgi:hypothetical protein